MAVVLAVTAVLLAALPPCQLLAQTNFAGTVVRLSGKDTVPVSGAMLQFHRVSQVAQGVIDSTRADARGRWHFRTTLQAGASYLVSARHAGIEFFTPPLSVDPARPDTGVMILVADTSSGDAARIDIQSRHLLVQGGDSSGWRGILDVVVLENRSGFTRIASDTTRPAYVFLLPPAARQPELADGDIGPEAVRFRDGSLEIYSPLAPGQMSLTVQYLLPASAGVGIPFGDTVATFNLLVDGEGAVTSGARLQGPVPTDLEGRRFRRWSGAVPGGSVVEIDLRAARKAPTWLLAVLVAVMAIGVVTALVIARKRPGVAKRVVAP